MLPISFLIYVCDFFLSYISFIWAYMIISMIFSGLMDFFKRKVERPLGVWHLFLCAHVAAQGGCDVISARDFPGLTSGYSLLPGTPLAPHSLHTHIQWIHTVQCTLYSLLCTLHTAHCTLYSVHCTPYSLDIVFCKSNTFYSQIQCATTLTLF